MAARCFLMGLTFFLVLRSASHAHARGIEETAQFQDCLRDPPSCLHLCVPAGPPIFFGVL